MRFRRFHKHTLRVLRGGLAAVAALAFLMATVGVPLPSQTAKDRSVPFPCMDRSCGCHDAAGCKEHCCCFSSDEKLAWAAEHGVDPAPFVESTALDRRAPVSRQPRAAMACCSNKPDRQPVADHASRSPHGVPYSIAAHRQCTGLAPLWTLLGAALPTPPLVGCEFDWISTGRVLRWACRATSVSFSPPTPPPRV